MDLDLLLAEADPARHADLPGPDSSGAARLYGQITGPALRPRRMRRAAQPGSTQPGSVAAILDAAAITAGHGAGASQPPSPGQYLYVEETVAKGLGIQPSRSCVSAPMTVRA